jgi:hypothetical protein
MRHDLLWRGVWDHKLSTPMQWTLICIESATTWPIICNACSDFFSFRSLCIWTNLQKKSDKNLIFGGKIMFVRKMWVFPCDYIWREFLQNWKKQHWKIKRMSLYFSLWVKYSLQQHILPTRAIWKFAAQHTGVVQNVLSLKWKMLIDKWKIDH